MIALINSDASINIIEKTYIESQEIQLQFIDNSYLLYNHKDKRNRIEEVIKITKFLKMQLRKHIEIIQLQIMNLESHYDIILE